MDWVAPKSPLINGLFVRRSLSNHFLIFMNHMLWWKRRNASIPQHPKKILLCNLANFGDVIISTTVLPVIKRQYPDCEIGFLASTAAGQNVLRDHPLIHRVHSFDHWYLQPSSLAKCKAALHWGHSKILRELKEIQYDLAIDLYPYFPNAIPLLEKSGIPVRIGYPTGGFSNLLTHPVKWDFADRYVGYAHLHLLQHLGIDISKESPLPHYRFFKKRSDSVVVHMGSSSSVKEWNVENWIHLVRRLEESQCKVILTGKGDREMLQCEQVAQNTTAKNLCNRLNWIDFVMTIQEARLLVAVDSVTVHIAAGSQTPTLVLFAGLNSPHMWIPPFPQCKGIMNRVSCSPCYKKAGCSTMNCIKGIEIEEVYKMAMEWL